ncbi:MAG TPA: phosphodiester glycosidase family protein [Patescibacteria group bacterium]|nr:phosphodiester glycosidase family protein [Patescibacteria group bacterium]
MTKKLFAIVFSFLFLAKSYSIISAQTPTTLDCTNGFQTLFPDQTSAITYKEVTLTSPRRMVVHIVKANINSGDLDFTTTPRKYLGSTTSTFLTGVDAAVAINGSGFFESDPEDPTGFNSYQGDRYSSDSGLGILGFFISEDNVPSFTYSIPSPLWDALSGVNLLVSNNNIYDRLISCPLQSCTPSGCDTSYCTVAPRTALGLNDDNIIIIVVDGRLPGYSEGARLDELATIMRRCEATNAVNMDGGGSSTLAASGLNYTGNQILNRPSDGTERTVSNHFGICIGSCSDISSNPILILPEGEARPRYQAGAEYPFPCNRSAPDNSIPFSDDEFHSLRPYQASPCNPNKEDLALFCGNDLFVGDNVTIIKTNYEPPTIPAYSVNGSPASPNVPSDPYSNACFICGDSGYCQRTLNVYCDSSADQCDPNITNSCSRCINNGDGTESCSFVISSSKQIAVDLFGAELPIMGYTEPSVGNTNGPKVINSQNKTDETMDHATKMNEYVSWYLNGVIGRAEYDFPDPTPDCVGESSDKPGWCEPLVLGSNYCMTKSSVPLVGATPNFDHIADGKDTCSSGEYCCVSQSTSDSGKIPDREITSNYSGPVKKLLPFTIQNIERIAEINDGFASKNLDTRIRHDQYVGCHFGGMFNVKIPFTSTYVDFSILAIPTQCYGGGFVDYIRDELHLSEFAPNNLPPVEEDYQGRPFIEFQKDYREWKGDWCYPLTINIPIFGTFQFLLCFNNPFSPDIFSNLFSFTPFTSTEDRLGDVRVRSVGIVPIGSNLRLISYRLRNVKNADLFFAHMEEDTQLSANLQDTFIYKDADRDDIGSSSFVPYEPYCSYRRVITNPGDDLFAGEISADVDYTVALTCPFFIWGDGQNADYGNLCRNLNNAECVRAIPADATWCDVSYGQFDCIGGQICGVNCQSVVGVDESNCESAAALDFPSLPYVNSENPGCVPESFDGICEEVSDYPSRSPYSIPYPYCRSGFKCVFNKNTCTRSDQQPTTTQACYGQTLVGIRLQTRTPLADKVWARLVAGSTSVFRKMFPKVGEEGAPIEGIEDIPTATNVTYQNLSGGLLFAGNPGDQRPGSAAQLYFPHIGALREYFLGGIQTMLRPYEYKDTLISSTLEGRTPTYVSSDCGGISDDQVPEQYLGALKEEFIAYCNKFAGGNLGEACYNDMVVKSIAANVNPAFTMSIWINESACSNYTFGDIVNDFGTMLAPSKNYEEQLDAFLDKSTVYWTHTSNCYQNSWFLSYMHAFLSFFKAGDTDGDCRPNSTADAERYYNAIKGVWYSLIDMVDPTCYLPDNPADMSCP